MHFVFYERTASMKKDHFEVLLEEMKGQFNLVLEGHDTIRHEMQEKIQCVCEKIDVNTFAIKGLEKRIDGVEDSLGKRIDGVEERLGKRIDKVEDRLGKVENKFGNVEDRLGKVENKLGNVEDSLSKKIDAVAADLSAHRADTESHRGYKVCDGK